MASDSESGLERQLKVPHIHTVLTEAAETHTLSLSLSLSLSLARSLSLSLSLCLSRSLYVRPLLSHIFARVQ